MGNKTPLFKIVGQLSYLTQLGLSVAFPIVLCIYGAGWLQSRLNLGGWVTLLGIILGVGSGITSLFSFINYVQRLADKKKSDDGED